MLRQAICATVSIIASVAWMTPSDAAELVVEKVIDQPFGFSSAPAIARQIGGFDAKLGTLKSVAFTAWITERLYGAVPDGHPGVSFFDYTKAATQSVWFTIPVAGYADSNFVVWPTTGSGTFDVHKTYDETVVTGVSLGSYVGEDLSGFLAPVTFYLGSGDVDIEIPDFNLALKSSATVRAVYTYDAAAVAEPTTWAMMIAGFALVGAAMRRRTLAMA